MEDSFQITKIQDETTGDYVSFVIVDGDKRVPGRISGTALGILAGADQFEKRLDVFKAHRQRIRNAAYLSRRKNPTLAMVVLGGFDFSG